jgi:hypothetical protein
VKVVGVGALGAAASVRLAATGTGGPTAFATMWVLSTMAIGLTANLVNLLDLRPGRALKAYAVLVAAAVGVQLIRTLVGGSSWSGVGGVLAVGALLVGPALAAWPYDLGERAVLGDAGANAAGALAGYVVADALGVWSLALYVTLVLALNFASEKISFSAVIESSAFLRRLDMAGRLAMDGPDGGFSDESPEKPDER